MVELEVIDCCSSSQQETCCDPTDKAECCGEENGGCGCQERPPLRGDRAICPATSARGRGRPARSATTAR
jgi:hypothetical protein